jgi:uncharacterized membrane protein YhaH (DUF805 family)
MFKNPFSFEGRIRRLEYGLSHIIGTFALYFVAFIILGISSNNGNDNGMGILMVFYVPYFWFIWAQGAKRCHDLGHSGWYQIIPFYGLWMLFADGDTGENEYGPNPKGIGNKKNSDTLLDG